jgi:CheY-like chemotaxis protein
MRSAHAGHERRCSARCLARGASTYAVPLIFLTASADSSQREEWPAQGANDYLVKPVDFKQLLATIERWLANDAASR